MMIVLLALLFRILFEMLFRMLVILTEHYWVTLGERRRPSFAARIKSAAKGNSQVAGAWGVPERTEALVNKWAKARV